MHANDGEALGDEDLDQGIAPRNRLHENDQLVLSAHAIAIQNLVEIQHVHNLCQLAVLLGLLQLDIILLQAMKGELCVVIHEDLKRLLQ